MSSPGSAERTALLRQAYVEACRRELRALKPGNVHIHAAGHGMTVAEFETSAEVSAPALASLGLAVGERIRGAVAATREAVGCNTNLGIILLAAPLLAAAERAGADGIRPALARVLADLAVEDAVAAYEAIRLAAPAGLGRVAEQDAASAPTVDLRRAMALAAERDRIARQYVTDYADIFAIGVTRLSVQHHEEAGEWAVTHTYLEFLAAFPDSHILRKHGAAAAEKVRAEAAQLLKRHARQGAGEGWRDALLAFDRALKADGLNPGTSADLTVASLLAAACEPILGKNQEQEGDDTHRAALYRQPTQPRE